MNLLTELRAAAEKAARVDFEQVPISGSANPIVFSVHPAKILKLLSALDTAQRGLEDIGNNKHSFAFTNEYHARKTLAEIKEVLK